MSRGLLPGEVLGEIAGLLPDLSACEALIQGLSPGPLSVVFPHESTVPVASVCFNDVLQTLYGVRHALHEYHAHGRWYRAQDPPNEMAAVFFERYYLDDAAFRLYNAGEDLASALQAMLDLSIEDLAAYREKRSSRQAQVGAYLIRERPDEALTGAVRSLVATPAWTEALAYRNDVVHEQAPSMEGTGITYERRQRWEQEDGRHVLRIGGGDPPRHTTVALGATMHAATRALITLVVASANAYRDILERIGRIRFTQDGLALTLS